MSVSVAWLVGLALPAAAGAPLLAHPAYRRFSLPSRAVLAWLAGTVLTCVTMLVWAFAGWPWTAPGVLGTAATLSFVLRLALGRGARDRGTVARRADDRGAVGRIAVALIVVAIAAAAAATVAGSATAGDLVLFWGTKGQRFGLARTIDVAFLADPLHGHLHSSYPPLLTNLYALATLVAGRFSWGAAALTFPLGLAMLAAALPGVAGRFAPRPRALAATALLVASIAAGGAAALIAGSAEMPLLLFEAVGVALLLGPDVSERPGALLAGLILAGAALTKVEGLLFVFAVLLVIPPLRRLPMVRLAWMAAPAAVGTALWLLFGRTRGLFEGYGAAGPVLEVFWRRTPEVLRAVGRTLAANVGALPYVLPALALLFTPRKSRGSAAAALAGTVLSAALIFTYLHGRQDQRDWIRWSADRVFLSVSILLALGAAAAEPSPAEGTAAEV
jgi:hypothetical protein